MRSVHARVAIVATVACVGVLSTTALGIDVAARMYHQEANQRLHLELASWLVKQYHFERGGKVDRDGAGPLFEDAMRVNPTIEIYLTDTAGRILAFNAPRGRVKLTSVDLTPIRALLSGVQALPILGTDPRNPAVPQVFSVAPIPSASGTAGYIYLIVGGEKYRGLLAQLRVSQVTRWVIIGAAVVLAVGLLCGLAAFWFLTRRIGKLAADMNQFSMSGFTLLPTATSDRASIDELDRLRRHFRRLSELVHNQVKQLRYSDQQLREAIAALSHDLQTPLTALGGYLETLRLQEETLSAQQRRQFLGLATVQTERLARMIGAQFELSLLESAAYPFEPQVGSLSDLVSDVAGELGITAQAAGVAITVEAPAESAAAWMDVSLIQRVLENLISNALRHTPAGGQVTLSVTRVADRARVCVSDTGCGIREDELARIFERAFRGSSTSRKNGTGAGLGLTIVQRIVELHGGQIAARNLNGGGAQFCFDLRVATHAPTRGLLAEVDQET
jgi:two-component system OmpR family sensor kinase